jgi:hypothetical protein
MHCVLPSSASFRSLVYAESNEYYPGSVKEGSYTQLYKEIDYPLEHDFLYNIKLRSIPIPKNSVKAG